jgi:hypothetical protein
MDQLEDLINIPELIDIFGIKLIAIIYKYMNENATPYDSELYIKWSTLEQKFGIDRQYFPDECKELYYYFTTGQL